jgi:hypothetical protein
MRISLAVFLWAALGMNSAVAATCSNPICIENQASGTPQSQWDLNGPGSTSIAGFADNISVNHGSTINFKVQTSTNNWKLDIYRQFNCVQTLIVGGNI